MTHTGMIRIEAKNRKFTKEDSCLVSVPPKIVKLAQLFLQQGQRKGLISMVQEIFDYWNSLIFIQKLI